MNLLVALLLIPLAGACVCALVPARQAKGIALYFSLATLATAIGLAFQLFGGGLALSGGSSIEAVVGPWLPSVGFTFRLDADGISLWLVLLTAGLAPLAIAASFNSIVDRQREYYAWMLALLTAMLGVFLARDVLLFYVFFELTLVPMFFIIGIWGGPERRYAAAKFFLFTFAGSVFTLAATVYVGLRAGPGHTPSFDFNDVIRYAQTGLSNTERFWVVMGLLAGFAVKVPLFPVHTWLPLAHTEAPTAGSVILAGVLLKLGTYGLLRLAVPIGLVSRGVDGVAGTAFPTLLWWVGVLCVIGIIYGALAAWVQKDIKKLVAYSSVSHLGFCVLGLMALNDIGMQGSVLYMINHGISTGALFLVVGMIYERYHTRDINALSGLARRMPVMAFFFILFTLSSIGLPGTNGFVSEFLTILGAFTSPHLGVAFGALAALGIILGAIYMLHMAARVIFGPLKTPDLHGPRSESAQAHSGQAHASHGDAEPGDLGGREIAILVPLAILVVLLGVRPGLVTGPILAPIERIRTAAVLPPPGPRNAPGPQLLPATADADRAAQPAAQADRSDAQAGRSDAQADRSAPTGLTERRPAPLGRAPVAIGMARVLEK